MPRTRISPSVGGVICDRIFSRVDLPEPLAPMMPSVSPACILKLISFSAQNVSSLSIPTARLAFFFKNLKGCLMVSAKTSRRVKYLAVSWRIL